MSIKSKHCPGPWIVDGNGFSKSYNVSGEYSICNVVNKADADLIAAAPSMYSVLESLAEDEQLNEATKAAIKHILKIARGE